MRRGVLALGAAGLALGCTAIAPFGDLTTGGGADGGIDAGPSAMCADAGPFLYDAGPAVDAGSGVEVCNRRDDDDDLKVDQNLLSADAPRLVPGVSGVGERLRATVGLRPDTVVAAFASTASATRGRLRVVEARIGGEAREAVVSDGVATVFDVATATAGYALAWVEDGEVRFGLLDSCALTPAEVFTLASTDARAVAIETSADGSEAYVAWVSDAGALSGSRIDLRAEPSPGEVGTASGERYTDVSVAVAGTGAWVAANLRDAEGDVIVLRSLGASGDFGPATDATGPGFGESGPFQNVHLASDPENYLILSFDVGDDAGVTGRAFSREIETPELFQRAGRWYGGEALILDAANDGTVASGLLLRLGGTFSVERVGANDDGSLSTDMTGEVPTLSRSGWLALVGVSEGPYRYVAVGRDSAGDLQLQTVTCE